MAEESDGGIMGLRDRVSLSDWREALIEKVLNEDGKRGRIQVGPEIFVVARRSEQSTAGVLGLEVSRGESSLKVIEIGDGRGCEPRYIWVADAVQGVDDDVVDLYPDTKVMTGYTVYPDGRPARSTDVLLPASQGEVATRLANILDGVARGSLLPYSEMLKLLQDIFRRLVSESKQMTDQDLTEFLQSLRGAGHELASPFSAI